MKTENRSISSHMSVDHFIQYVELTVSPLFTMCGLHLFEEEDRWPFVRVFCTSKEQTAYNRQGH
jgi:hypothetical protein